MLEISGIDVAIAGVRVVRGVSMSLPHGARVALVGRNGAGKTTTLRAIMGLAGLRAGTITLDGRSLTDMPAHRRTHLGIGYAPEERRLFGRFTVQENMLLPAEVLGLDTAERKRRLGKVFDILPELAALAQRRAAGLSGGQGKMVALGRAMITGTRLVILDEPFQGLAPALALRYADTLKRLRAAEPELAILITESNPALLEPLVERTYVIERGEIASS